MFEIIPAILETDFSEIEQKLEKVKGYARTIHVDLLDGRFAPNTTFLDPVPFTKYKDTFLLEAHMMVDEPVNYLKPFADAGFRRFVGHIEKMSDQVEFVARGQMFGEVGLALDKDSGLDDIKVPLDDLDSITVMMISAGFAGQKFEPELLEKIKQLRSKTDIPIEVDGGINDKTLLLAKDAGATRFCANSALFVGEDIKKQWELLSAGV